jgi:hypothetical protein
LRIAVRGERQVAPPSLDAVIAQLTELRRFADAVTAFGAEDRQERSRSKLDYLYGVYLTPAVEEPEAEEPEAELIKDLGDVFGVVTLPRGSVTVVRMSLASPFVVVLSVASSVALPRTLKGLVQVAAMAWNLPVTIRRDRAQLEAETAEEVLRKIKAENAEAELRAIAALVKQGPPAPSPRSLDLVLGEADSVDLDELAQARD